MVIYVDINKRKIVSGLKLYRTVDRIDVKRGEVLPLSIVFTQNGESQIVAANLLIALCAKLQNEYDGPAMVLATAFTLVTTGTSHRYDGTVYFTDTNLNDHLSATASTGDELEYVDLQMEISWHTAASVQRFTTESIVLRVHNDVCKDGDGVDLIPNTPFDFPNGLRANTIAPLTGTTITSSGAIVTTGASSSISTTGASGYIETRNTFRLTNGTNITTLSHAPTANRAIAFSDESGTSGVGSIKSANFTAVNGCDYIATATLTVTDPTPSDGLSFRVLVRNGTVTVGGVAYGIVGTIVERVYHSGAWVSYEYKNHAQFAASLTEGFTTNKATIVDGDKIAILDSAASSAPKHSLWSLVKSTLKTYFDTLYAVTGTGLPTGGSTGDIAKKNSGTNYDVGWETPTNNATANAIVRRDASGGAVFGDIFAGALITTATGGVIYTEGANAYIYTDGANASIYTQGANSNIEAQDSSASVKAWNFAALDATAGASLKNSAGTAVLTWGATAGNISITVNTTSTGHFFSNPSTSEAGHFLTKNGTTPTLAAGRSAWFSDSSGSPQFKNGTGGAVTLIYNGSALGTPASGTLTFCTGLPISTGVSGLGTGVATLLAGTPSGTGGPVGTTSPTLTTPTIGAATGTTLTLGTTLPTATICNVYSSGSSSGNVWRGRMTVGGDTARFLMGEINGQAWLGAHNAALNAWNDFYINPDGGAKVGIGDLGSGSGNVAVPILTVDNTTLNTIITTSATSTAPLLVSGPTSSVDTLRIQGTTTASYSSIGFIDSGGTQRGSFGYAGTTAGSFANTTFVNAANGVPLTLGTNSVERIRIATSGGVSIGTTTDAGAGNLLLAGTITTVGPASSTARPMKFGSVTSITDASMVALGFTSQQKVEINAVAYWIPMKTSAWT